MKEAHRSSTEQQPSSFSFTREEQLYSRVSHDRFLEYLSHPEHSIYRAGVDTNSYGEFLFITAGRANELQGRIIFTFFGLGLHEYRDRYVHGEWHFYPSSIRPEPDDSTLGVSDVLEMVRVRQAEVTAELRRHTQSSRGKLFEQIADLTDDDGAIADMEDFPDWFDDLGAE